MLFKYISYLELWWPFYSAERNNLCLCNFGRVYPEEQLYKKYFEFGPVVQEETTFERLLICSSGSHPVQWSRIIYAVFVKSSVRNNSEFILYLDQWFRRRCRFNQFLSRALAVPLFRGGEQFVQFW